MKLLKPSWVNHEGNPIYSIDIHPDGSRFATGGQGVDTGRVIIWNMAPVLNEEDEQKETVPKLLCQMDNHLACVNCVRWSKSGKYLASGGDDRVIIVWAFSKGYGSSASFGGTINIEHWRAAHTLRGHSGDILDICWSNNDEYMASCSVDNNVIIWNATKFPELVTIIRGHSGLVKGVCWDPIGKYVASQSDDKTVKIWRTSDWQLETTITEPFVDCGGTTHVLRLHWSPDGQYVVSAHAMNNRGSTAQIIEREGWKTDKDFVGHRKAVTCVRFNSHIMMKKCDGKIQKCSCLAIGSRDRSLSVWLTNLRRPLVVIHDLFVNSLLDLSWSSCGYKLASCSWDGTVAFMEFDESEIGNTLSAEENKSYLQNLYGKSINSNETGTLFIEDVNILKAREEKEKSKVINDYVSSNGNADSGSRSNNDSRSNTSSRLLKGPTDKQIETRMPDGRRRITPLYIPPPIDCDGTPLPFNANQTTFSSSTESKTKIVIEKRDESSSAILNNSPENKQTTKIVIEKTDFQQYQTQTTKVKSDEAKNQQNVDNSVPLIKRKAEKICDKDNSKRKPGRPPQVQLPLKSIVSEPSTLVTKIPEKKTLQRSEQKTNLPKILFPMLKIDTKTNLVINLEESKEQITIEAKNNISSTSLSSLSSFKMDNTLNWEVLLSSKISGLAACEYMVSIANEDNTISVFDFCTGRRLHPPILISSSAALLLCKKHYLMVITVKGSLSLWDFDKHRNVVKNESLLPLISSSSTSNEASISNSGITDSGSPIISLSNGKSYVFDTSFICWSLISNANDLLNHFNDFKLPWKNDLKSCPLYNIQSNQRPVRNSQSIFLTNPNIQQSGTLSYIDQQLASAFVIGSTKEYRYWLIVLAQFLTTEGLEIRLRELCQYLLGPLFRSKNSEWEETILGSDKHELLKEILAIMTTNLKLQRIYTEFKEQLDIVTSQT